MFDQNSSAFPRIVALDAFGKSVGRSPATLWRMRQKGWIKTVNIAGKQYITAEAIADFVRRAEAGEFEREVVIPRPTGALSAKK